MMINRKKVFLIILVIIFIVLGIFLILYIKNNEFNRFKNFLNNKYVEELDDDNKKDKVILVDKFPSNNCAHAIEYFYWDDQYKYYFNCIKSDYMYVIVNDVEYKLVDALENSVVTIEMLENNGYIFKKEKINLEIS